MLGKKTTHWLIITLIITLVGLYLNDNSEALASIKNLTVEQSLVLLGLTFASFLCLGYQFKITMRFFDITLGPGEWFGLTICNNMYNYFLPARGGMWLRAFYLKKKHGFQYPLYIPLVLATYILMCFTSSTLGTISVGLNNLLKGLDQWKFFSIFPLLLLGTLVASALIDLLGRSGQRTRYQWLNRFSAKFQEGTGYFRSNPRLLIRFFLANGCFIVFNGIGYGYCLSVLGVDDVSLLAAVGVMSLTAFSMPMSITPGNLGVREMIMGMSCFYLGTPFDIAFLAACIIRVYSILFVFFLGIIYSKILMGTLSIKKLPEPPENT